MSRLQLPPLSLYIHIPWCERKCPYCDFNSHAAGADLPEAQYVQTLLADLTIEQGRAQDRPLQSIFIGGGTPSLFSAVALRTLLDGVRERIELAGDCEITMEANPGSAEAARFAGYAEAGVNRLSLGVQSFDDQCLAALGRVHDSSQAHRAIDFARRAGIANLNIDLMHGLPGQTADTAETDLRHAIAAAPDHLSWYQLTIERNTAFWSHPPLLPDESRLADIQDRGEAIIAAAGFENYEVSAYARPGRRCRHNLNYWEFGDYIGIGAGAHGKLTVPATGAITRTEKRRQPDAYLAAEDGDYTAREFDIPGSERPGDFMLNALRLSNGVELALFPERTGLGLGCIESRLADLEARGLLALENGRVHTTATGRRFLDDVVGEFL